MKYQKEQGLTGENAYFYVLEKINNENLFSHQQLLIYLMKKSTCLATVFILKPVTI